MWKSSHNGPPTRLNRTSVGLKPIIYMAVTGQQIRLNRTSVGLKPISGAHPIFWGGLAQSNQRGIETCGIAISQIPTRRGSIEPAWD